MTRDTPGPGADRKSFRIPPFRTRKAAPFPAGPDGRGPWVREQPEPVGTEARRNIVLFYMMGPGFRQGESAAGTAGRDRGRPAGAGFPVRHAVVFPDRIFLYNPAQERP